MPQILKMSTNLIHLYVHFIEENISTIEEYCSSQKELFEKTLYEDLKLCILPPNFRSLSLPPTHGKLPKARK